ncbi:MAG: hypothetical protein K6D37_00415 [Prevotella sp.]|nr:hypothetical protein [Prevotella sp.]
MMKRRLYTLLTTLFATLTVAFAQNFEFQYQGKSLDDRATVAISAGKNIFGETACETNPSSDPQNGLVLKLLNATTAEVSASMQILSNTLDGATLQWCMGGNCILVSTGSTENKSFTASTTETVQFDAANIQSNGSLEALLSVTISGVTKRVNIIFTNNSRQVWWNYYNTSGDWMVRGSRQAERYYVATHIPYGYNGNDLTVEGLSFYFLPSDMADVEYWVSTKLPEFGGQADLETVKLSASDITYDRFNQVEFKTPHAIPEEGLYVGYSFTITGSSNYSYYPISYRSSSSPCSDGFYMSTTSAPEWAKNEGDLLVSVLSSGQFKNNAISFPAGSGTQVYTLKGEEQSVDVTLTNAGTSTVRNFTYVIKNDGKEIASGTRDTYLSGLSMATTASIPLPTDLEPAAYDLTLTVTEVNGHSNESDSNNFAIRQYNMLKKSPFMPLFEEFTGTWCGYCVRGIVAMEKAQQQYGDKAAIIAVHDDNAMGTQDYQPIIQAYCNGYPSGVGNRSEKTSISTNTVVRHIENTIDNITPAAIEATAYWADEAKTAITVDTKTTFQLSMTGNYAIAYVLIADGLTGTGSSWAQSNYYSGESSSDPDMQYWCEQPSKVTGVVYNHVAVAAWQPQYGVQGSVSSNIRAGEAQSYSFNADISGNTIIQDKSKLKMITLLLNADTGEFINAAQTTILEGTASPGDANGDGLVNYDDIEEVANYIMGSPSGKFNAANADANGDKSVNAADIVTILNIMAQ